MNALKHMEVIFGAVVVVGCVIAALPGDVDAPAASQAAAPTAGMPVVVVKAKRMTALEKRESLGADERAAATGS